MWPAIWTRRSDFSRSETANLSRPPFALLILNFKRQYGTFESVCHGHSRRAVSRQIAALNRVQQTAQQIGGLAALPVVHVTTVTVVDCDGHRRVRHFGNCRLCTRRITAEAIRHGKALV